MPYTRQSPGASEPIRRKPNGQVRFARFPYPHRRGEAVHHRPIEAARSACFGPWQHFERT